MRMILRLVVLSLALLCFAACGGIEGKEAPASEQKNAASAATDTAPIIQEETKNSERRAPTMTLNNGYQIPMLGLGTYSLHGDTCVNAVYTAIKSGYRLIDTASVYSNEAEVGEGVRRAISDGIITREDIFVTTKLYPNQFADPENAIEESLRKLDIGYLDLMLLHHPGANDIKAYRAIEKYIGEGKIRSAGLSCYYVKELKAFLPQVTIKPVLVQNEMHPYYQDSRVVQHIQSQGIATESWYPLGGRGHQAELLQDAVLQKIAAVHQKSVAQIILRWNYERGVIAIPGSSNPTHIAENMDIFDFSLTTEEMEDIAKLERREKHDWY